MQVGNSLLVRPELLLIKDIKVQVNKQKPNNVRPAQMKHNSDKMTIAPMSSRPCSKPNVACWAFYNLKTKLKNVQVEQPPLCCYRRRLQHHAPIMPNPMIVAVFVRFGFLQLLNT